MNNKELLTRYLLNLITVSANILKFIEDYDAENVEEVGEILSRLQKFEKENMTVLPF